MPRPKPPKKRAFLILGGGAGLLVGVVLAVVVTLSLPSGTGPSLPSPTTDSPGNKAIPNPPPAVADAAHKDAPRTVPSPTSAPTWGESGQIIVPAPLPPGFVLDEPDSKSQPPTPRPAPATAPAHGWESDPIVVPAPKWKSAPIVADAPPAPIPPEELFEKASPAVVYITVRDKDFKPIGLGSGFFVDPNGLIVTNYHVIKGARFATARLSSGGTLFVDGVVATNPNGDLALLKVGGSGFPNLRLANGLPKIGATVYAIGNPRGLENTFSGGMVSGHREIEEGVTAIQVTAPISPGSSGGPLLNAAGEVIGVTTAYLTGGQNLNFAVPVSGVSALMRKQGKVQTLASAGGQRLDETAPGDLDQVWNAMAKQDWATATRLLTDLRKTQPENPMVWCTLGVLHGRLGNHEIAIAQYKQAIAIRADYALAYLWMGDTYQRMKRYSEAIAAYSKILVIRPDSAYYRASAYCGTGYVYHCLKRYPEAIEAYKKAIDIKADCDDAYAKLGDTYHCLKRYPEAIEAYKKAVTIEPDAKAYRYMGLAYAEMKRYVEAIEAFKNAIAVDPNDNYLCACSYCGIGRAYLTLGRLTEAAAAFEQYVRFETDFSGRAGDAYWVVGNAYVEVKRYPEAIEAYKKAVAIDPNNAFAYQNMADAYRQMKRYAEAIEADKRAAAIK